MRYLPPLNGLRAFEAAARHQSLTKAAEELNVTRAAVSQQVKQLELYLDAQLFERHGAKLTLTEDAEYYLPVLSEMFESLSVSTHHLFERKKSHQLTLHVAQSFCYQWLMPRLADFKRRFPKVKIKVSTTSNAYPNGSKVADLEIINGYGNWLDKSAVPLTQENWIVVASPELTKSYSLHEIEGISSAPKIETFGYREGWGDWFNSAVPNRDGHVNPQAEWQFEHSLLSIEAAENGLGVLLVRDLLVEEQLIQGTLVKVSDHEMPSQSGHYLISNSQSNLYSKHFTHWLKESLR
ncbi:LysR substrate-binding domain-containing protein [Vibrio paucivorans]|uniref:LysR substrate-binding domain-containing protein n=1 Tax=Vibrio paucivorans TaxID=2829489 RepID=A0A9X3HRQ6_9VIBR|nr:LysR substrate-binding domain-containing protein [Vibrio paucivorans]MCW8334168.1 LysR substrate-binding domain-containing protein [Vibrio paucivorans]